MMVLSSLSNYGNHNPEPPLDVSEYVRGSVPRFKKSKHFFLNLEIYIYRLLQLHIAESE